MSVYKQKTSSGETKWYYYEFMLDGKRFKGRCIGCTKKRNAEEYEKQERIKAEEALKQKSKTAIIRQIQKVRYGDQAISLKDAFECYLQKPSRRQCSEKQKYAKRGYWNDFLAFMQYHFPEISLMHEVTRTQAEQYISYLRKNGRFTREVANGTKASYQAQTALSGRTVNVYHTTLKSVFEHLREDAGLDNNPFHFNFMENYSETREAFTLEELQLINDNMAEFVRPLFVIGLSTGLSEGDICTLRWSEIQGNWIIRRRRKTNALLEIPISLPLRDFLNEQKQLNLDSEYVLPEHAQIYLTNPSGISYRFKNFLSGIGICTTRKIEGRSKSVSIKDVHSLRHTYAYLAGCYNVPLSIVQSVLGHMTPEMTRHYQAHANRKDKENFLKAIPAFLSGGTAQHLLSSPHPERKEEIIRNLDRLSDDQIQNVYDLIEKMLTGQ